MELSRATLRQHLSCGACAIALVGSLLAYKGSVAASPLSAAQRHWEAIATANPELLASRYSDDAILQRSYLVSDANEVFRGHSIYSAWQEFFSKYDIKGIQVVEKQVTGDRGVEAQIQIVAKSSQGLLVVLSMYYEAHFDRTGKIVKEVWQTDPKLSA